jgi:ubiquinone/menaquinone biosynthesis C-methylase UbiE
VPIDYSRRAKAYDAVRSDPAVDQEYWLRGLIEVGGIVPGEWVLDVGAGTGRFAALLHPGHRVVALDAERSMLRVARAKAPFNCVQADAHRLPFQDETFDVTIFVMVLHQLADYRIALREAARVSHRVVIATTDMANRRLGVLEEAFPSLLAIDRGRFPSIPSIAAALGETGLRHVQSEERPYVRTLTSDEQLNRVRQKYLSTFDLLPPGEYDRGLRFLEREIPKRFGDGFEVSASFTFVVGTR